MTKPDDDLEFRQAVTHHVARLNALLQSPEWGLFSWADMVGKHMTWLNNWWEGKFEKGDDWKKL